MQCPLAAIKSVEIGDPFQKLAVAAGHIQQMPVQAGVWLPGVSLAEFVAHEDQFFSGQQKLVGKEEPQVCEFLPDIAGHDFEKGWAGLGDQPVRKRQNVIGIKSIQVTLGEAAVSELTV